MQIGKQFRLDRATIAVDGADGKRRAITVPPGSILKVVDETANNGDGTIGVLWDGRIVEMFAVDVEERGAEIDGDSDGKGKSG